MSNCPNCSAERTARMEAEREVERLKKDYQWATVGVGFSKGKLIEKVSALQKERDDFQTQCGARKREIFELKKERDEAILKLNQILEKAPYRDDGDGVTQEDWDEAMAELRKAGEALNRIVTGCPAINSNGCYVEHFDEVGNNIGDEQVHPISVIQSMVGVAENALSSPLMKKVLESGGGNETNI